ncbi:Tho complex subunit [Fragilaria crotonensis]|nr:Tho complex subunit [Fragilaria crotonensis]
MQPYADLKREELERKNLVLENLVYERNHLKAQLDDCKEFPTPHLERMSRDELCDDDVEEPAEKLVNRFLCGSAENSIQDPKNHKTIMTKLHKELNSRGLLQRDLEKAQSSLTKRKLVADKEEAFFRDIPKKLEMIEKSSIPLQEFFQSSASDNSLRLIGSDRKKRLQLAQSLPGPLYALFVQLQAIFDGQTEENESVTLQIVRKDGKGKEDDEATSDSQVVQLDFLVPDIHAKDPSGAKKKRVTVEFGFFEEFPLVTARAFGGGDKINTKLLLTNIFPGDSGNWNGNLDVSTRLSGKPYHWCNFLAGLVFPSPVSGNALHLSTKAVIRAIETRVRANTTLTQLLSSFERKKVVVHPSFAEKFKISEWRETDRLDRGRWRRHSTRGISHVCCNYQGWKQNPRRKSFDRLVPLPCGPSNLVAL